MKENGDLIVADGPEGPRLVRVLSNGNGTNDVVYVPDSGRVIIAMSNVPNNEVEGSIQSEGGDP